VHGLGANAVINIPTVTESPRVSIRAKFCQEGAGSTASLRTEALSILADAAELLQAILLAVSLAAVDTTNIPKVILGAEFLDVRTSGVATAEVALSHSGVEDGDVNVRAIAVDCQNLAVFVCPDIASPYHC
jgi:tRNA threonylcarbamoyladenosine modification (KEOPS) complex Cgi121 subunit